MTRALVLGGGGVAGIAWETGFLLGLLDTGVDVSDADRIIGTSAGSCVGTQIATGADLHELFESQLVPPPLVATSPKVDMAAMIASLSSILTGDLPLTERLKAIGQYSLSADTPPEGPRIAEIAARLPVHEWPDRDLQVTAIDANTGELRVFTPADAGTVELVQAVAASCAVPGIRPPVTIGATRYVDGGARTMTNCDLATGCDAVLIVAPFADLPTTDPELVAVDRPLRESATVLTVTPDAATIAAIGTNPLDLATAKPCALAGRTQAAAHVDEIAALWKAGA